jgi:hypothetical protein
VKWLGRTDQEVSEEGVAIKRFGVTAAAFAKQLHDRLPGVIKVFGA